LAGNVNLLSRRDTFTGDVNALVVIDINAFAFVPNVFEPEETAIQDAGNGGVCVE
jgi:hypothetical protein